ncbi:5-formyltetrahydrofolate cyclo-ligase [Plectosphaerella cucumerina]|uniref:5-formyltetrahydrofolate cyclo-ligase n=1 Tax=Plectosphaerella cucumerina TaxID=40658 RepID=A0A8K0TMG3_9PEZI|nr:5-formyltetrahydrofolate cyclo-ligase [Plectosphaerella cucumerina]
MPAAIDQTHAAVDDAAMGSVLAAKQHLRSVMKTRLSSLSHDAITSQSRAVFETLKTFKPYQDAQRISVFLSMPSGEIQTDAIVRHALAAGKQVYVPFLHKSPFPPGEAPARVMDMVRLRDLQDYESLGRDKWGIPSIDAATVSERHRILGGEADEATPLDASLDMILVPGVAFDIDPQTGLLRRLGHGKGFYDLFIRRLSGRTSSINHEGTRPTLLCGLALSEQFLPQDSDTPVPVAPHDKVLDGVVLGDGEIRRSSDGARLDT